MNPQDRISILLSESTKVNLKDLNESVNEIIMLQGYLIQKVYELKPKLKEGEVYIETLITKLIFASKSVIQLSKPQDFEIYKSKAKIEIIDSPSVFILTRSIIETFLTLEYLYFDSDTDAENVFRFRL
ncbi:MAG: hypothetical protein COW65_17360 [Cytophagales bacterium CG18_big_fil_WC_8_21_14_2_50_42_9]|nr:MAG: hypothetical protein COW65_17360 [Cytophagales bacterium CG18_big_fil_WC_8_21_14_2_50_42_9]